MSSNSLGNKDSILIWLLSIIKMAVSMKEASKMVSAMVKGDSAMPMVESTMGTGSKELWMVMESCITPMKN